jgi:hypothetical protein
VPLARTAFFLPVEHATHMAGRRVPQADPDPSRVASVLAAVKAELFEWPPMAAILDRACARWRARLAVGAEESLRRGRTKEMPKKK